MELLQHSAESSFDRTKCPLIYTSTLGDQEMTSNKQEFFKFKGEASKPLILSIPNTVDFDGIQSLTLFGIAEVPFKLLHRLSRVTKDETHTHILMDHGLIGMVPTRDDGRAPSGERCLFPRPTALIEYNVEFLQVSLSASTDFSFRLTSKHILFVHAINEQYVHGRRMYHTIDLNLLTENEDESFAIMTRREGKSGLATGLFVRTSHELTKIRIGIGLTTLVDYNAKYKIDLGCLVYPPTDEIEWFLYWVPFNFGEEWTATTSKSPMSTNRLDGVNVQFDTEGCIYEVYSLCYGRATRSDGVLRKVG